MTLTRSGPEIKTIHWTQVAQRGNSNARGSSSVQWYSSCRAGIFLGLSHSNIYFIPCMCLHSNLILYGLTFDLAKTVA